MTYKNEKAQGIVEYALILAFIVGVAVALFNSGGLADAIGKAFYEVSETINNAIDNSPEAKQERMRNTLEDGLKDAIRHSRITLGVGDWVEIDAQEELNSDPQINAYINGGARLHSPTLKVGENGYGGFTGLWDATKIPNYKVDIKQDSGWTGVRIVSTGKDQYTVYYYKGDQANVGSIGRTNYSDLNYMNTNYTAAASTTWNGN
ncbi:MAG: Pilus assembly protein [Mitsuokella multacida]|jgi:Flp pilus assembly pilin Flp